MCNLSILAGRGRRIDIKAILSKEIKKHISLTAGLVGSGAEADEYLRPAWLSADNQGYMDPV